MITTALAILISVQAPQQDASASTKASAAAILTKAFGRYANAQSLSGTIKTTQTAEGGGQQVTITTLIDLQFDRPSKIYLHESRNGKKGGQWLLVSDGTTFGMDRPPKELGPARYIEQVTQHDKAQTIGDLYIADTDGLGEQNPILDIAISVTERLRRLRNQWATLTYKGKETVNGQVTDVVTGDWREEAPLRPTGTFEADVTGDGEIVRYIVTERFALPTGDPKSGAPPVFATTRTQWDADLKIGSINDPAVYKVH